MIVPDKISIVPYALFFGGYGIIKYYIEKLDRIILEYILKFLFFNACACIVLLAAGSLFKAEPIVAFSWWLLIIAGEIVFFIYDFVYTLFINYYRDKLRTKLRR